jgi:hypothetical protein
MHVLESGKQHDAPSVLNLGQLPSDWVPSSEKRLLSAFRLSSESSRFRVSIRCDDNIPLYQHAN